MRQIVRLLLVQSWQQRWTCLHAVVATRFCFVLERYRERVISIRVISLHILESVVPQSLMWPVIIRLVHLRFSILLFAHHSALLYEVLKQFGFPVFRRGFYRVPIDFDRWLPNDLGLLMGVNVHWTYQVKDYAFGHGTIRVRTRRRCTWQRHAFPCGDGLSKLSAADSCRS